MLATRAQRAFADAGVECVLALTERAGHAAELARDRSDGCDAVFALGGDGTAMEVAGALAGTQRPMAVLAGGTGNLLARALGIPFRIRRAVPTLLGGDILEIDLGHLGSTGQHFAIAAGAGIDASMVAETPPWLKRRLGVLAYSLIATWAGIRTVFRRDYFRVRVTVDGVTHEGEAAAVMIANFGAVLGERITLGPGIRSDDGVLDVCVFAPRTLLDALRIMWRLLRKRFVTDGRTLYHSGRQIRIETFPPRLFQADGELVGSTPVEVSVQPRAVRLLVPRRG